MPRYRCVFRHERYEATPKPEKRSDEGAPTLEAAYEFVAPDAQTLERWLEDHEINVGRLVGIERVEPDVRED